MAKTKITSAEYFKTINMIYYFMLGGQLLLGAISIYLAVNNTLGIDDELLDKVMMIAVSLYFVVGMAGSYIFFKKRLSKTVEMKNFMEKTASYRGGLILHYAMIEGIALLAIVGFMVTGIKLLIAYLAVTVAYFYMLKPSKEKMASELNLNPAEIGLINNPDSVISEIETTY